MKKCKIVWRKKNKRSIVMQSTVWKCNIYLLLLSSEMFTGSSVHVMHVQDLRNGNGKCCRFGKHWVEINLNLSCLDQGDMHACMGQLGARPESWKLKEEDAAWHIYLYWSIKLAKSCQLRSLKKYILLLCLLRQSLMTEQVSSLFSHFLIIRSCTHMDMINYYGVHSCT